MKFGTEKIPGGIRLGLADVEAILSPAVEAAVGKIAGT